MAQPKVARWLDLLAYLLYHQHSPRTREQIFEAVAGYRAGGDSHRARESARRTFERDKDELKRLGIAIRRVPVPGLQAARGLHHPRVRRSGTLGAE